MVSTSSEESMVSERYGRVKKKSNVAAADTAATAPATRPPTWAATTTVTTRASAMLVLSTLSRTTTERGPYRQRQQTGQGDSQGPGFPIDDHATRFRRHSGRPYAP